MKWTDSSVGKNRYRCIYLCIIEQWVILGISKIYMDLLGLKAEEMMNFLVFHDGLQSPENSSWRET